MNLKLQGVIHLHITLQGLWVKQPGSVCFHLIAMFLQFNIVWNLNRDNHALMCAGVELLATKRCKDYVVCGICFLNVTSQVSLWSWNKNCTAIHKVGARVVLGFSSRAQHWRGTVLNAFWTPQQTSLDEGVERSRVWGASQDNEGEKTKLFSNVII